MIVYVLILTVILVSIVDKLSEYHESIKELCQDTAVEPDQGEGSVTAPHQRAGRSGRHLRLDRSVLI